MSDHDYTRTRVDGYWDLLPANLTPAVQAALPGKAFTGQYDATAVKLLFVDQLSPAEITTLDATVAATKAAFSALPDAKAAKIALLRGNTDAFIAKGAVYNSQTYMSTDEGRFDVLGIFTVGVLAASPGFFPKKVSTTDGETETEFADATAFVPFFNQMMLTYSYWKESGQVLRQQVIDATTVAEVDAVVDNRTWPAPI